MSQLWIGIAVTAVLITGVVRLGSAIRRFRSRARFAQEFTERLRRYAESGGEDTKTYSWLIDRSPKMQEEMGNAGIVAHYRPPFSNHSYENYPIILNMLPDMRRAVSQTNSRLFADYCALMQESLIRYSGLVRDESTRLRGRLFNPIVWFGEGVRVFILMPFLLLRWLGLEQLPTLDEMSDMTPVKIISAVFALIGFLASVVTILTGWDQVVSLLNMIIR